ncbi:MAG: GAF domain-containing protein [Actinomycetota bacterium]|nr:GAF domain-containing protein [Actinomycetota bacterium]
MLMHPARPATGSPDDDGRDHDVGRDHRDAALTFPDGPRLELDQLLGQLVGRAQEVMAVQGRLRGLLRANQMIISDLDLPTVLRHIVEAARELIGARYAAVGVTAVGGNLAEFVHAGMAAADVERIGHLPQGKGLLGALIQDPEPIRLSRLTDDSRSCGFPVGHPAMNSFLGVPIRVRDEAFGNLYLCESTRGEFSVEDEELAQALAVSAAVAIDNARLFDAARTRHEWLRASAAITQRLLSVDGHADLPLRLIAEHGREIACAELVTVVLPDDDGEHLRVEVAVGAGAEHLPGLLIPLDGSLVGRVFATGEPIRVSGPDQPPGLTAVPTSGPESGPALVIPLLGPQRTHGVLTATRPAGRTLFTAEDLDMAVGFANQASLALELAEARTEQQRASVLDERDRIAADLHDHVIQRLFAAGLSLQSVAASLGPGPATDRVRATINDLDDTISQIRTTIFGLHQVPTAAPVGVRARLLTVIADVVPVLGFEPAVRFSGLLEGMLPDDVVEDLLAVLREALTNIARHAQAHAAEVDLAASPDRLSLDIRDNGIGIAPTGRRSGLTNLSRRAEQHGGALTLAVNGSAGTWLSWSIPNR